MGKIERHHPEFLGGEMAALRREVGAKRDFSFEAASHVDLGERLGMFDFETGGKVCGSRFVYLTGAGAMLELALINWAMAKVVSKGFTPMVVPELVRQSSPGKCGFQPRAENTQVYNVEDSDLCLAGTAEILLGGVYMDEVVTEKGSIRMAAFRTASAPRRAPRGAATQACTACTSSARWRCSSSPPRNSPRRCTRTHLHRGGDAPSSDSASRCSTCPRGPGAPAYRKFDVGVMPALERYGEILRVQLHGLSGEASEHQVQAGGEGWEEAAPGALPHPQRDGVRGAPHDHHDSRKLPKRRRERGRAGTASAVPGGEGKTHAGRRRGVIVT